MSTLLIGGAGYIGSHISKELRDRGERVVILDNFSTGLRERVTTEELVEADLLDESSFQMLASKCAALGITQIVHLAALKRADVSLLEPVNYMKTNIDLLANALRLAEMLEIRQFVLSSTAAVYGVAGDLPITEASPCEPINPYGASKRACEDLLMYWSKSTGVAGTSLRYFNVAGASHPLLADRFGRNLFTILGQHYRDGSTARVFGHDYETRDGSAIRDYVHAADVAAAHVAALAHFSTDPGYRALNIGSEAGVTVLEVLEAFKRCSGRQIPLELCERRDGDPPIVIADSTRLHYLTGWRTERTLEEMVRSTLNS